jgi:hypothetical protein
MSRKRWWHSLGLGLGVIILLATASYADDKNCARVATQERGLFCGPESLMVMVQNICNHPIQISICVEETGGEWDCGLDRSVQPEKYMGRWTCKGTGKYHYLGCSRDAQTCNAHP